MGHKIQFDKLWKTKKFSVSCYLRSNKDNENWIAIRKIWVHTRGLLHQNLCKKITTREKLLGGGSVTLRNSFLRSLWRIEQTAEYLTSAALWSVRTGRNASATDRLQLNLSPTRPNRRSFSPTVEQAIKSCECYEWLEGRAPGESCRTDILYRRHRKAIFRDQRKRTALEWSGSDLLAVL